MFYHLETTADNRQLNTNPSINRRLYRQKFFIIYSIHCLIITIIKKCKITKIQMNGLIGLKKLLIKNILNIMNMKILKIFKKLVPEHSEKCSVQIEKILKII